MAKIPLVLVGAGLIAAYVSRPCCNFVPTFATDCPIRGPNEEETNRRLNRQPSRGGGGGGGYPGHPGGGQVSLFTKVFGINPHPPPQKGGGSIWDQSAGIRKSIAGATHTPDLTDLGIRPGSQEEVAPEIIGYSKSKGHPFDIQLTIA